jgi:hypothetical protein
MDNWQSTFLGLKQLPRELTAFEIEAFFTFTLAERQMIEDRRRPTLKFGPSDWLSAHEWAATRCGSHGTACAVASSGNPVCDCGAGLGVVTRPVPACTDLDAHQQLACEAQCAGLDR